MALDPSIWTVGTEGPPGADGNTVISGIVAPTDSIGVDGDYYINYITWELYGPKASGTWPAAVSLIGPAGADGLDGAKGVKGDRGERGITGTAGINGSKIYSGLADPDGAVGVNGDYFINLTTYDFFGPKTAGAWPIPINLKGADGLPLDLHYGARTISINTTTLAVTAAVPADLTDNTDYVQITGIWDTLPAGEAYGVTQQTDTLTVTKAGTYLIILWGSVTSSINNTNVAFKFGIDGVVSLGRRPWARIGTSGDRINVSAFGIHTFAANEVVSLHIAADQTADITINDCNFALVELTAAGRSLQIYDEAVELTADPAQIAFTGAGVTATLSAANQVTVDIPGGIASVSVEDEGIAVVDTATLNFEGAGVTVTEDPAGVAKVTIPGGGAGGGSNLYDSLPSGTPIFNPGIFANGSTSFGTSGRVYNWIYEVAGDLTAVSVDYRVPTALGTTGGTYYFELHEIDGNGQPGACVLSVELDMATEAVGFDGHTTTALAAPVALTAGYYFASVICVTEGSAAGSLNCYASVTSTSDQLKASLLVSDYWYLIGTTTEYNCVYFATTVLPGGVFTPNTSWAGTTLTWAAVAQHTGVPTIGLIKQ